MQVRVPANGWKPWSDWWEIATADGVIVGELTGLNANLKRAGAVALYCLDGDMPGGGAAECRDSILPGTGWKHLAYVMSESGRSVTVYIDGQAAGRGSWGARALVTGFSVGIAKRLKRSVVSDDFGSALPIT